MTTETATSAPSTTGGADTGERLNVRWLDGDRFDIDLRQHRVTVDQPIPVGGDDTGPTPTELFVGGLASCVAFYARRYLRRHGLDASGLEVETSYRMGTRPARVTDVTMTVRVPAGVPEERRNALLAMATHCTVHNSITTAPEIQVELA
jgi:uncharacterized OsmC-like protein